MIHVTPAAHHHLIQLLSEHPEEHLVRIEMKDIDDHRIAFNIALYVTASPLRLPPIVWRACKA